MNDSNTIFCYSKDCWFISERHWMIGYRFADMINMFLICLLISRVDDGLLLHVIKLIGR